MSALATVVQKSFNIKFTAKIDFCDRTFYVTIADADIGSLKSLHTLFDKYLDHMLVNLNKILWSEPYKMLCFLTRKWLTAFDKVLTPFWKTFP